MRLFRVLIALFRHTHPFGYFRGVHRYAASRQDWHLDTVSHDDGPQQYLEIRANPPDGLVVSVGPSVSHDLDFLREFRGAVVSVSPDTPADIAARVVSSQPESYLKTIEHFHALGRSHVSFLALKSRPNSRLTEELVRGLCAARGMEFSALLRVTTPETELLVPPRSPEDIPSDVRDWLLQLPKGAAVVCRTDSDGCSLIRSACLLGRSVPEDLAFAGRGDFLIASTSHPPLTSFELPFEEIGYQAAALLDRMMRGEPRPSEPIVVEGGRLLIRGSTQQHPEDVHQALAIIRSEAMNGLTVKELCGKLLVSRVTLERRFRAAVGYTPGEAIRLGRLDAARKLLEETDLTVEQICLRSGFESPSSFSKFFRERTGHSPGQYRDLQRSSRE